MTDDDKDRRIDELEATIQELRNLVEQLQGENADLRARLEKDGHNSSKPPSSDGLRKRARSPRPVEKKSTGEQRGHAGHTLPMVIPP
jgi:transposase